MTNQTEFETALADEARLSVNPDNCWLKSHAYRFKKGASWARSWTLRNDPVVKELVEALVEITNTTRLNDPDNYLAEHLKCVANKALASYERAAEEMK